MKLTELWRCNYVADAYEDQTGKRHWGNVVTARCVVIPTGETFPMETGYNVPGEATAGKVYLRPERFEDGLLMGDEFRYYPNLIDYVGGGSWRNHSNEADQSRELGWWQRVPVNTAGYVHPDGTPVEPIL